MLKNNKKHENTNKIKVRKKRVIWNQYIHCLLITRKTDYKAQLFTCIKTKTGQSQILGGACDVMVTVEGNGHSNESSNPEQGCLYFT